jgi:DNA mismatch endonuclease (patch repair protein)
LTDSFTARKRSSIMRCVKSARTRPEEHVRGLLRQCRIKYRSQFRRLPGTPDFALPDLRVALFVHGCFWHGHGCPRGRRVPKSNRTYWTAKVARNIQRDAKNVKGLRLIGWRSVVLWECRLSDDAGLRRRLFSLAPKPLR